MKLRSTGIFMGNDNCQKPPAPKLVSWINTQTASAGGVVDIIPSSIKMLVI